MENKLLIVDGHNLLFQMFYGMPNKIRNENGKSIHAVIGFIGDFHWLMILIEPTHCVILFDGEHPNKRNEVLPEYKANRIDYSKVLDDDNPFSQLNDIYKALDYMHIKYVEVEEFETDDVISSYVKQYGNTIQIYISSFDSDYFQLVNENVKIIRYRGKNSIICDSEYIFHKFNIKSNLYADYKSLVGDSADNIKGIVGVGPKTATKIIRNYGSIDDIYQKIEQIKDMKIKQLLFDNQELVRRNYQLIKLDSIAPIPFEMEELVLNDEKLVTMNIIRAIS